MHVVYQFTDLLVVAIKGHWLGSLDTTALQDLEWGIRIAGGRREEEENLWGGGGHSNA